jgi:hypothetical protein
MLRDLHACDFPPSHQSLPAIRKMRTKKFYNIGPRTFIATTSFRWKSPKEFVKASSREKGEIIKRCRKLDRFSNTKKIFAATNWPNLTEPI